MGVLAGNLKPENEQSDPVGTVGCCGRALEEDNRHALGLVGLRWPKWMRFQCQRQSVELSSDPRLLTPISGPEWRQPSSVSPAEPLPPDV